MTIKWWIIVLFLSIIAFQLINATKSNFKYASIVSLQKENDNNKFEHLCTGVILDSWHVLTSSLCVKKLGVIGDVKAKYGSDNLLDGNRKKMIPVVKANVQSEFNKCVVIKSPLNNPIKQGNNLAVLILEKPIDCTQGAERTVLPKKNKSIPPYTTGTLVGWGVKAHRGKKPLRYMNEIEVKILPDSKCKRLRASRSSQNVICIQTIDPENLKRDNSCMSDAGTVLMVDGVLAGLSGKGQYLCGRSPTVFTNIANNIKWIEDRYLKTNNFKKSTK